jgi:hypothetical protein
MDTRTDISIVGVKLFQPIADLVGKLISRTYAGSDRAGTLNYYDNAYSMSIILLSCTAVESLVQRNRYFYSKAKRTPMSGSALHQYVKSELKYRRHQHIEELFTVRNAIAHNHIWEVEYSIKSTGGRQHKKTELVVGSHQIKGKNLPKQKKVPRTNRLRMHLSPSSIDRTDARIALAACIHFIKFLSSKGSNPVNLTTETVALQGRQVPFLDMANKIEDTL